MKRLRRVSRQAKGNDAAFADLVAHVRAEIDRELETLGRKVYGDNWPKVLAHNTKRMTGESDGKLTDDEKQKLIKGLRVLESMRT